MFQAATAAAADLCSTWTFPQGLGKPVSSLSRRPQDPAQQCVQQLHSQAELTVKSGAAERRFSASCLPSPHLGCLRLLIATIMKCRYIYKAPTFVCSVMLAPMCFGLQGACLEGAGRLARCLPPSTHQTRAHTQCWMHPSVRIGRMAHHSS